MDILLFIGGLFFILIGVNCLIDGVVFVVKWFCIFFIVIGLIIVVFGIFVLELIVSVLFVLKGSVDIVVGNVVGSNIFNILMIVGCIVLFVFIVIIWNILWKEILLCIFFFIVLLICVNDVFLNKVFSNILSILDGLILFCFFIIFLGYIFVIVLFINNI